MSITSRSTWRWRAKILRIAIIFGAPLIACEKEPVNFLTLSASAQEWGGQVTARVVQPGRITDFTNDQFLPASVEKVIPVVTTGSSGNMEITFTITRSAADTVALGSVTIPLDNGYVYFAHPTRHKANSVDYCIPCTGVMKFPLRGSEKTSNDSLWIYYSKAPPCPGCVF